MATRFDTLDALVETINAPSSDGTKSPYDDQAHSITLYRIGGAFVSPAQLLVADVIDNLEEYHGIDPSVVIKNGQPDDRTHLIALGGQFKVSYRPRPGGPLVSGFASVPISRVVKVSPFILKADSGHAIPGHTH